MKQKFLIFFSNNTFESTIKLDETYDRLIKRGVVTFIYDIEKNTIKGNTPEGLKDIKVDLV